MSSAEFGGAVVRGVVQDALGAPLADCALVVSSGGRIHRIASDDSGLFEFLDATTRTIAIGVGRADGSNAFVVKRQLEEFEENWIEVTLPAGSVELVLDVTWDQQIALERALFPYTLKSRDGGPYYFASGGVIARGSESYEDPLGVLPEDAVRESTRNPRPSEGPPKIAFQNLPVGVFDLQLGLGEIGVDDKDGLRVSEQVFLRREIRLDHEGADVQVLAFDFLEEYDAARKRILGSH
ncbi:MAG: hypothetical protein AAFU73_13505 [Planctomycetota bacterium]